MEAIKGWEEVKASGDFERLPNGAYLCTIISAEDNSQKQYLRIEFDITGGCDKEYLEFAKKAYDNGLDFWMLQMYRSYTENAQGMFKGFIETIEKSNDGFKWDWDETKLDGQDFGAVICTEHYLKDNGDEGLRYKVKTLFSIDNFEKYQGKTYEDLYAKNLQEANKKAEKEAAEDPFK